ncbi:hypothetical protein V5799_034117 [Amblyomma americanum]|uniref:Uncharacterized protein n=1 Tax=Amblyomma americanum TaxID=6943 RepID=A0AAQ4DLD3_AMBAM
MRIRISKNTLFLLFFDIGSVIQQPSIFYKNSLASFAETTYQVVNLCARVYMLWCLILCYHSMHRTQTSEDAMSPAN